MNFYVSSYSKLIYVVNMDSIGKLKILNSYKLDGIPTYIKRNKGNLFISLKRSNINEKSGFVSYKILNNFLKNINYYYSNNSFTHLYANDELILGGSYHQGCIEVHYMNCKKIMEKRYFNSKIHNVGLLSSDIYYAVDLNNKKIYLYKILNNGIKSLFEINVKYNPRHICSFENGKLIYVLSENASKVLVYKFKDNNYELIQEISTLPYGYKGINYAAAIRSDNLNKYIFVSNRGHNSITIFDRNNLSGLLSLRNNINSKGEIPRDFNLMSGSKFIVVLNEKSNNVVSMEFNQSTNVVKVISEITIPKPSCIEV